MKIVFVITRLTLHVFSFFTFSSGYLKKNYSTFFSPSLPEHKLESMQKIGFGTSDKIFVEFESMWWDANCDVIHLVWQDEVSRGSMN